MRPEVPQKAVEMDSKLEGVVPFMYLDVKNLVTCAIGNLVDPVRTALCVPFVRKDGSAASAQDIADDWHRVKARTDLSRHGGMVYEDVAQLRLTPDGVVAVMKEKLQNMDRYLSGRFPEWEQYPWQVQLALLSYSWAAGPAFTAPHLEMAIRSQDWTLAASECHLEDSHNPGLVPRNAANKALFLEAAGLDGTQSAVHYETLTSDDLEGPAA